MTTMLLVQSIVFFGAPVVHADPGPPDTSITSGQSGVVASPNVTFTFTATEAATFECRLNDDEEWVACSSPASFNGLLDGAYNFAVRAIDFDDPPLVDDSPDVQGFVVDTTAPDTTIDSGPSGSTPTASAEFTFSSNDPEATFGCALDNGPFQQCTSPKNMGSMSEGPHIFRVIAIDGAGNEDETPAEQSFVYGIPRPETTIDDGPSGTIGTNDVTYTFSSDDPEAFFECSLDGAPFGTDQCTSPRTYLDLPEGPHMFEVRAINAALAADLTPAARSITIDTTEPDTTILSGPTGVIATDQATFTFSSDDPLAEFECRLDSESWSACPTPRTISSLAEGAHTFEVRAIDEAGNVDSTPASRIFTVDTEAPDTTIHSGPSGPTASDSATFTFTSGDGTATFECSFDGSAWYACSSPQSFFLLAQGPHSFQVRGVDGLGNEDLTPATRNFQVDTVAPDTTIDSGPSGVVATDSPTFTFSSNDGTASFRCKLDSDPWATCSTPLDLVQLEDGPHTVRVEAFDAAGNVDATPAERTFTVDTSAPTTSIDGGPSGLTASNDPSFTFSSDDPSATFECKLDLDPWDACTSPHPLSDVSDGSHTFSVRAADTLGNVDQTPATRTFTVDTVPPGTTIDTGPSGSIGTDSAVFTFSSGDAGASFECSLNGAPATFTPCTSPQTYSDLAEGVHAFEVRAKDPAGNLDPTPATRSFTVDTVAPETVINTGPPGTISTNSASFTFSSPDPTATFECLLDSGTWTVCTSPHDIASLAEGPHVLSVRAIDPTGNVDPTPASRSFTVDTDRPETTIDSGPSGPIASGSASFTFSSDEPLSTFECSVDSGTWEVCTSPRNLTGLTEGSHSFRVRAMDAGGNVDLTPALRNFSVDTLAPDTALDSGPSGTIATGSVSFGFSSPDGGASFECRLDSGSWNACSSPRSYPSLGEGPHTFEVRAKDGAGNVDPTPASSSFTVDLTAPNTQIDDGPSGVIGSDSATFDFSSSDPTATFECSLNAASWSSCTSPEDLTSLGNGPHTFEVRAKDGAGNIDPTPATGSFVVDTGAPNTIIDDGPSGATASADALFSFSADESGATFECSLNGLPFSPGACSSPYEYTDLNDGTHTFEVVATDAVGNIDPTPATRIFTVDTTAPETTIDSGPTGSTTDGSPTFTFSSDDPTADLECSLDSGAWEACASPDAVGPLVDGPHTYAVRATDPLGNVDPTPATRSFTVDRAAPETQIDSGPTGTITTDTTTFTFSSDDPTADLECSLDSGAWTPCTSPEVLVSLAEGTHEFSIRAFDAAGNVDDSPATRSFSVDVTVPDTTIDTGPADTIIMDTTTFTFSSDDPAATFECNLDTSTWIGCSSPYELESLGDGAHVFAVRAIDGTQIDATPASDTFTVDTAAPGTAIDSGPAGSIPVDSATFTFSSDEPSAVFECSLDSAPWGPCSSPTDLTGLSEGTHTFKVRAGDGLGNSDLTPATRTFVVDMTAPDTTITDGPNGPTPTDSPSFTFSSDDPSAGFECSLDGLPFALDACSSPKSYSSLSEGTHTFEVRAVDGAGNADPTPSARVFEVDTEAPGTTIDTGPDGAIPTDTASFGFSSGDGTATFECRVDAGVWDACTSPEELTALADGTYTFEVRAVDPAGNVDQTPASATFTVDTLAPETTLDVSPSGTIALDEASFAFSSDDAQATFECSLDSAPWDACTSTKDYVSLSEGAHTFAVRAIDEAGNVDDTPAESSFSVDTNAPNTAIDSGPSGVIATDSASFTFSSGEPTATFECRLDGGDWEPCTSPVDLTSLSEGPHTFAVRALDALSNADPTPASRSFNVDTTAPETTIESGPSGPTWTSSPSFTFSSDDPSAGFECSLDMAAWAPCGSPHDLAALSEGDHAFEVRAIDGVGNTDSTPASRSFTVDTVAPETSIDGGPSGYIASDSATFDFTSEDATAGFQCSIDEGPWDPCTSPHEVTSLGQGPHSFEVRAVDGAGNVDQTPPAKSFVVDTVAPEATIDSGPSGAISTDSVELTFSSDDPSATFECSLNAGPWDPCSSPHSVSSLADGQYTVAVRAVDEAGNFDGTPPTSSFTVDTVAPDTSIDSGPTGDIAEDSASFTFSSDETAAIFDCKFDDGEWGPCTEPLDLVDLADGQHEFSVRAEDEAGNADPSPATATFTVDTSAPETTIDSGPSGPTAQASVAFEFSSSDATAGFECAIDGGSWDPCTSPLNLGPLSDGSYEVAVRARDGVGNVDPTPATRGFTVDTQGPDAPSIDDGPPSHISTDSATFAFSSSELDATFECSLDGATFTACTSPQIYTGLGEGDHSFAVRAVDAAGNQGAQATADFNVDISPPGGATIDSGPFGFITVNDVTFTFSSADPTDVFECRLDLEAWTPCSTPMDLTDLAEGEHTFDVRTVDLAGNPQLGFESRTFTVDTVAPAVVQITDGPSGVVGTNSVTFSFTGEPGDTFECSADSQTFTSCTSGVGLTGLPEGGHVFEVRAVDQAGNVGPPASAAFTVDTVAPGAVSIDSAPSGTITSSSASITFSSADPSDLFECSIDGQAFGACTSPLQLMGLAQGPHTVDIRAIDEAGNTGPISAVAFSVAAPPSGGASPTPTPTTPSPSPSPSPSPTPAPSPSPSPSQSPTPSPSPSPTEGPKPTPQPTKDPKPTPQPTKDPKPTPQPTKDPGSSDNHGPDGPAPHDPDRGSPNAAPGTGGSSSGAPADQVDNGPFTPKTGDGDDDWSWPKSLREDDKDVPTDRPDKEEPAKKETPEIAEAAPNAPATLPATGGSLKTKIPLLIAFGFLAYLVRRAWIERRARTSED